MALSTSVDRQLNRKRKITPATAEVSTLCNNNNDDDDDDDHEMCPFFVMRGQKNTFKENKNKDILVESNNSNNKNKRTNNDNDCQLS